MSRGLSDAIAVLLFIIGFALFIWALTVASTWIRRGPGPDSRLERLNRRAALEDAMARAEDKSSDDEGAA